MKRNLGLPRLIAACVLFTLARATSRRLPDSELRARRQVDQVPKMAAPRLLPEISANYNISTIAGTGVVGYDGDDIPAISSEVYQPRGVVVDANGNLYIADTGNNRIRKVFLNGTTATIAGTVYPGYNGDGIPATSAQLNYPCGLAVDTRGSVYIADYGNNRIRKVLSNGIIETIAGNGTAGYFGDGFPATSALLNGPGRVIVDTSGSVFFSEEISCVIRNVAPNGTISTVAGTGTCGYNGESIPATAAELDAPRGVAVDTSGNLYIADMYNNRIRQMFPNGTISTVAGTGTSGYNGDGIPATSAQLSTPIGVAVDASGNLYIADMYNNRIRQVFPNGTIATIAGTGTCGFNSDSIPATSAQLCDPVGVATGTNGNVYIADTYNSRIRQVVPNGAITTIAGTDSGDYSGDGISATSAQLYNPVRIAVDISGNLYIADKGYPRIQKVFNNGTISSIAGTGVAGYNGDGVSATSSQLNYPSGVAVDGYGNVYIADSGNNRIRMVLPNGIIATIAGTGTIGYNGDGGSATSALLNNPSGVAVDVTGNVFIADSSNYCIRMVLVNGIITTIAGTGIYGYNGDGIPPTSAQLFGPSGVAVDICGIVYIADANARIRKVFTDGAIATIAGSGTNGYNGDGIAATSAELRTPADLAVDASGNVYIADSGNNRIRIVFSNGTISTIAGTGAHGYNRDGIPATTAYLSDPYGIAVDVNGNVFIADTGNNRIRKLYLSQAQLPWYTPCPSHSGTPSLSHSSTPSSSGTPASSPTGTPSSPAATQSVASMPTPSSTSTPYAAPPVLVVSVSINIAGVDASVVSQPIVWGQLSWYVACAIAQVNQQLVVLTSATDVATGQQSSFNAASTVNAVPIDSCRVTARLLWAANLLSTNVATSEPVRRLQSQPAGAIVNFTVAVLAPSPSAVGGIIGNWTASLASQSASVYALVSAFGASVGSNITAAVGPAFVAAAAAAAGVSEAAISVTSNGVPSIAQEKLCCTPPGNAPSPQPPSVIGLGVGFGVGGAVFVAILVIAAVIVRRKRAHRDLAAAAVKAPIADIPATNEDGSAFVGVNPQATVAV